MTEKTEKIYLLRLWQEEQGQEWRSTLTNPITNERYGFGSLVELFEELEAFDQRPLDPPCRPPDYPSP